MKRPWVTNSGPRGTLSPSRRRGTCVVTRDRSERQLKVGGSEPGGGRCSLDWLCGQMTEAFPWDTAPPVLADVTTLRSQKFRMLLTQRKLLQSKAIAIENDLRAIAQLRSQGRLVRIPTRIICSALIAQALRGRPLSDSTEGHASRKRGRRAPDCAKCLWRGLSLFVPPILSRKPLPTMRRHDPGAVRSSSASG